jgi:hypothetical protein
MNYIIEDGIDFYEQLHLSLNTSDDDTNICLISREHLDDNHITLPCQHSFNYIPLYNEINQQKNGTILFKISKLSTRQIKCPYCRTIHNKLIPFIPLPNISKYKGINHPPSLCMKHKDCSWMFISGKKKTQFCSKSAFKSEHGTYCEMHLSCVKRKQLKINTKTTHCKCSAVLKSGTRKGDQCGNKASVGPYCKIHKNYHVS